ncbi:hypothetical protein os1_41170 [Comamonadaceae bacterium OS-1]|nr:hypothetical protein os1_41170 [Comamonadaceae bacterium OS-1]
MMLALLVLLTVSVLVVPLLPALREWRRPSDVVPLPIDEADALDPPYLAQRFAALLRQAVQGGATHLGGSGIAHVALHAENAGLPLLAAELAAGRTDRLWHIEGEGDVHLPEGIGFYAEVSASAGLHTAAHHLYRAVWSGGRATLAPLCTVLRWAHGQEVHVGTGCHLAGRVTAEKTITVAQGVDFMLLHAPRIDFAEQGDSPTDRVPPPSSPSPSSPALTDLAPTDWPAGVVWNPQVRRAFARSALQIEARRAWHGDVVCLADLALGGHCQADGSLKARGDLHVGAGSHIRGNIVAGGSIHLGAGCVVRGSVLSETAIVVGPGCTVGAPGTLATVTAPHIAIAPGATVYGTIWAEETGQTTTAADAASDEPSWTDLSPSAVVGGVA